MPNPFFRSRFTAIPGNLAQPRPVDFDLEQVEAGFDAVYAILQQLGVAGTWIGSKPDVPPSYAGNALKLLRCNVAQNALEFVSPGRIRIINVTASRNIADSDMGALLICNSATPITLTFQQNVAVPIDTESAFMAVQWGAGKLTLVPASGVTLRVPNGLLSARTQFAQITAVKTNTDEWLVGGDRAA